MTFGVQNMITICSMLLYINSVALSATAYYNSDEHMTDSTRENIGANNRESWCYQLMNLIVADEPNCSCSSLMTASHQIIMRTLKGIQHGRLRSLASRSQPTLILRALVDCSHAGIPPPRHCIRNAYCFGTVC